MFLHRKEHPFFLETRIEGIVLTAHDDAVQLEMNVIPLRWRPAGEACVKTHANFVAVDDIDISRKPMVRRSIGLLYEDTIT